MAEQKFKRNTAYKLRIGDIFIGKPIFNNDKFTHLELGDKKIARVNIIGNIVDKYENQGETQYLNFTLDDGSGQIKLKIFGDDVKKFKDFEQGTTVVIIGRTRHWNNEVYITPEIIREMNPKYLLLRKKETESERAQASKPLEKSQVVALKDKILNLIKEAEEKGGIQTDEIILKIRDASPNIINQEIQKLLEEGIAFEPRPGKIRWLG